MNKIIYILLSAFILLGCENTEKKATEKPSASMMMQPSFETITLKKSNPATSMKLPGEIIPDQQVSIYAKVNSYVKNLKVDIGTKVSKGQLILELEAPEIGSQLAAARSKWKAQEATFISTNASYERMLKASKTEGAISRDALDQIAAKRLADQSQLDAAKSVYQELKSIQDYLIIRAPFDGVITERNVDLGSYVGPTGKGSEKPLLVIQTYNKLRLVLSIPEANTSYLNLGDTIRFIVKSHPHKKYFGKVVRMAGALDSKFRSERIEVDILNTTNDLKPLMVAEATIPLKANTSSFFVPKSAVVESNLGVYIIQIVEGKTKMAPVSKGRVLNDQYEVFGELSEGDKILKTATEEIQEGIQISKK